MTPSRRKIYRTAVLAGLLAAVTGCASLPPPTNELAAVDAAIAAASSPDGQRYAADELAAARNEQSAAKDAMTRQEYEQARRLAAKAQADADLARARSRALAAQSAVAAKTEDNETLRRRLLEQEPLR